jgi:hypothetical protein
MLYICIKFRGGLSFPSSGYIYIKQREVQCTTDVNFHCSEDIQSYTGSMEANVLRSVSGNEVRTPVSSGRSDTQFLPRPPLQLPWYVNKGSLLRIGGPGSLYPNGDLWALPRLISGKCQNTVQQATVAFFNILSTSAFTSNPTMTINVLHNGNNVVKISNTS